MPKVPLDVAIGAYESSSKKLAAQECVNMFPKAPETVGGLAQKALFYAPGISLQATVGDGPGRGAVKFGTSLFVVSGSELWAVKFSPPSVELKGTIAGTGRCVLVSNGETIAIQVPGGSGYWYDDVNGLVEITDPIYQSFQAQALGVRSVAVKDGYFVFITQKEAFLSDLVTLNGGRGFPGLTFFTAEIKPDNNVTVATIRNELYIVGEDTIELFQNTGSGDTQPFQRIQSATIDNGCAAQFAFIEHLDNFMFIGGGVNEQRSIYRGSPGGAIKISTSPIDEMLNAVGDLEMSLAYAFSFQDSGNFFVGFTVDDKTFIYDSTSSTMLGRPIWHTRTSSGSANGEWRVASVTDVFSSNVVQDTVDGRLGILSRDSDTEYGDTIPWTFSGQYLANQSSPLCISRIDLRTETPNLSTDDQTVKLEISFDGAETWVDYGEVSLGTLANLDGKQQWRRIGETDYQVIFRLSGDNANRTNILEMYATGQGGSE